MAVNEAPPAKATLASIAEIAGVSVPTVSKVINGRDDVATATRDRVLEVLRRFEYRSNVQRRHRNDGPELIDVVVDSVTSAYYTEVMDGILECTASAELDVVMSATSAARMTADERATRMLNSGRHGLLLVTSKWTPAEMKTFQDRGIPVVVIDPLNPPDPGVVSVGATNWAGGKAATKHLLDLGHTRIAFIGGRETAECSQARQHGYMAALMEHGVEVRSEYILPGDFRVESGHEGLKKLLALKTPPQAVFAANDSTAIGVLNEAKKRGIAVPEELSVVGFDGTYLSEQAVPQLTTVAQPLRDLGRTAVRALIRGMKGDSPDSHRVELATRLIVRESTAPPSSNL